MKSKRVFTTTPSINGPSVIAAMQGAEIDGEWYVKKSTWTKFRAATGRVFKTRREALEYLNEKPVRRFTDVQIAWPKPREVRAVLYYPQRRRFLLEGDSEERWHYVRDEKDLHRTRKAAVAALRKHMLKSVVVWQSRIDEAKRAAAKVK